MMVDATMMIKGVVNLEVKWNVDLLQDWFNVELINCIVATPPPLSEDGEDKLWWGCNRDKKFFYMDNSYIYLTFTLNDVETNIDWSIVWKWKGHHRIKTFAWLMLHGRILTNSCWHK